MVIEAQQFRVRCIPLEIYCALWVCVEIRRHASSGKRKKKIKNKKEKEQEKDKGTTREKALKENKGG